MLLAVEEALGRLAPGELSWLRGRTSVDSKKARMLVGTNEQGTNRVDKERVCMREVGGQGSIVLIYAKMHLNSWIGSSQNVKNNYVFSIN